MSKNLQQFIESGQKIAILDLRGLGENQWSWDQTTKQRIPNHRIFLVHMYLDIIIYFLTGYLRKKCSVPIKILVSFSNLEKIEENCGGNKISCLVFGPGICVIYFISFPQKKNCHQRKLRQTKCLLFNFWAVKLTQVSDTHFAKSSSAKCFFGATVSFIIQKSKSKHLVCRSFQWLQFFWGNERKYFTHIPGLDPMSSLQFYFLRMPQKLKKP